MRADVVEHLGPTGTPTTRFPLAIVVPGLGTGGAERSLLESLPGLLAHGAEPTVICLHRRHQGVHRQVEELGVPVLTLSGQNLASRVRQTRALLRARRPLIVHTTLFEANLVGRLASAGLPLRVLTSLVRWPYDLSHVEPGVARAKVRMARSIEAISGRFGTDHYHAISDAVKLDAAAGLGIHPARITVIPRGRDPIRLGIPSPGRSQVARSHLDIAPDRALVLNVSRQEHQKGQRHLLLALRQLRVTIPDVLLVIAGRRGHASPQLDELVDRYGLADNVRFLGHRDDIPDLLAAADIFAFPSLSEGLGGAAIEAMALGVPMVASNIPALREVTGGTAAVLVPPADPAALADAIAGLLAEPARARSLGVAARARYLEHYTLSAVVDRTWQLYQRLVAGALIDDPGGDGWRGAPR